MKNTPKDVLTPTELKKGIKNMQKNSHPLLDQEFDDLNYLRKQKKCLLCRTKLKITEKEICHKCGSITINRPIDIK